jgi:Ser/Thr protein kinase RdoA (MazF antagonist)
MTERLPGFLVGSEALPWAVRQVLVVERFPATVARVYRLALSGDRAPGTVVAKIYGRADGGEAEAELRFYRQIAPVTVDVPAPRLYATLDGPAPGELVLLTEDLTGGHRQLERTASVDALGTVVERLADFHARWFGAPLLADPAFAAPRRGPSRISQAYPLPVIAGNAASVLPAVDRFLTEHRAEVPGAEQAIVRRLTDRWEKLFTARCHDSRSLTVGHGDLHLGNVFRRADTVTFIDWAEHKPALPAYDVAYLLIGMDSPADRLTRDEDVLRRYHQRLVSRIDTGYEFAQCRWDFRFALLTNLFQSVLQNSLRWFLTTTPIVRAWRCAELLE